MAVRKKSKRSARKSRKARKAPKSRKVAKRTTRKRVAPRAKRAQAAGAAQPPAFLDDSAAPRCRSRIPVEIDIAGRREHGAIADMSASGARIVGVKGDGILPGTPLEIRYASVSAPVLLSAEFVRSTDDGFAVKILPR
jgi:PilZ domain-containing protein